MVDTVYQGFINNYDDADQTNSLGNYDPKVNPVKHIMHHILQPAGRLYTQWKNFGGRIAFRVEYEQHICVYQGKE